MGWGELHRPKPGVGLAFAVKRFLLRPTTGNRERLQQELDRFESGD